MDANYPFYPTRFTLSFRQGGANHKWGLWFSLGANDFLVNPEVLAKTISSGGRFTNIFFREYLDNCVPLPLPFKKLIIRNDPWNAPSYNWELEGVDGSTLALSFDRVEYIKTSYEALRSLFRFQVIDGRDAAYEVMDLAQWVTGCLADARHRIGFAVEQIQNSPRQEEWAGLDLSLPVERFSASLNEAHMLTLGIGSRSYMLSLLEIVAEEFRHNLEHLIFHDRTSITWEDPYCNWMEKAIELKRQSIHLLSNERPVLLVTEEEGLGGTSQAFVTKPRSFLPLQRSSSSDTLVAVSASRWRTGSALFGKGLKRLFPSLMDLAVWLFVQVLSVF